MRIGGNEALVFSRLGRFIPNEQLPSSYETNPMTDAFITSATAHWVQRFVANNHSCCRHPQSADWMAKPSLVLNLRLAI
jgi:hypothetical protein